MTKLLRETKDINLEEREKNFYRDESEEKAKKEK